MPPETSGVCRTSRALAPPFVASCSWTRPHYCFISCFRTVTRTTCLRSMEVLMRVPRCCRAAKNLRARRSSSTACTTSLYFFTAERACLFKVRNANSCQIMHTARTPPPNDEESDQKTKGHLRLSKTRQSASTGLTVFVEYDMCQMISLEQITQILLFRSWNTTDCLGYK